MVALQVQPGWFLDPLLGDDGDFSDDLKNLASQLAQIAGLSESPLKGFSSEEKTENKG